MLATLLLVVCLAGDMSSCAGEKEVNSGIQAPYVECSILGQQMATDWLSEHPKYRLGKWRCVVGHREGSA